MNWCVFMDKIYKVVSAGENFGNLVCVSCKKNLLVSFLDLLDTICAILSILKNPNASQLPFRRIPHFKSSSSIRITALNEREGRVTVSGRQRPIVNNVTWFHV